MMETIYDWIGIAGILITVVFVFGSLVYIAIRRRRA